MAWLSVDEFKNFLSSDSITLSTSDESLIQTILSSVETFISNYCNRPIEQQQVTEILDINSSIIQLKYFPVSNLSLYIDLERKFEEDTKYEDFLLEEDKGLVILLTPTVTGEKICKAIYIAGFATVPADLKLAGYTLALFHYDRIRNRNVDALSISAHGESTIFTTRDFEIPPTIKQILDKYRLIPC